jgi:hypothetical protein
MASRKLLFASIGVAAATFSCSSAASGNCCAYADTGEANDTLFDSHTGSDSAHDTISDVADSFADTEASDADADEASDGSSVDVLDAEASDAEASGE